MTENPAERDGSAFKSLLCSWAIKVKIYFDSAIQTVPWLTNASWQTSVSFLCGIVLYYWVLVGGHTIYSVSSQNQKRLFHTFISYMQWASQCQFQNDGLWSLCSWSESPSPGKYNSLRVLLLALVRSGVILSAELKKTSQGRFWDIPPRQLRKV